jgi:hypothetical protein
MRKIVYQVCYEDIWFDATRVVIEFDTYEEAEGYCLNNTEHGDTVLFIRKVFKI